MTTVGAEAPSEPLLDADRNRHIGEYLEYYVSFPHSPRYAVLLNGAWGVGKTFLVKRFFKQFPTEGEPRAVYVSLFGLSTLDEVDEALLRAIYPALGWRVTRVASRIAKGRKAL
jgi:predicted ATPase